MIAVVHRAALALLALIAPPSVPPLHAAELQLTHSAAQLGRPLALEVRGAPPGAALALLAADGRGCAQRSALTLELDPATLRPLAFGRADAEGAWSHELAVPLERALAERWLSVQALVADPAAPGGWTVSPPAHLRLAGTRLYATCWGDASQPSAPAELVVRSALDESVLGVVPLARTALPPPWTVEPFVNEQQAHDGEPVFSADLARGAVVAGHDRLVLFDNASFQTDRVLHFEHIAGTLLPAPDGESVLVLQLAPQARVLRIRLLDGVLSGDLKLTHRAVPHWAATHGGAQGWIGDEFDGLGLRHVDLENLVELERVVILQGASYFLWFRDLRAMDGMLVAALERSHWYKSHLMRYDPRSGLGQIVSFDEWHLPTHVPQLGIFLLARKYNALKIPDIQASRTSDLLSLRDLPPVPTASPYDFGFDFARIEPAADGAWVLDTCCVGSPTRLLHLDLPQPAWTVWAEWPATAPADLAVVQDALVDKVYVGLVPAAGGPLLVSIEPQTGARRELPVGSAPRALRALTVP